jgi:glycosyltransferase involved in cell wall biosynthesis
LSHPHPTSAERPIRIGIDGTNIRLGGGVTHLLELISAMDAQQMQVEKIYLWAGKKTLEQMPERDWLIKVNPPNLDGSIWRRIWWQIWSLSSAAKAAKCDVLLVPGGSYVGSFHPVVTMSQNLFPFEWSAISKNGWSFRALKFLALRLVQSSSFRRSEGVIFLTQYAKDRVLNITGPLKGACHVIHHGLSPRFHNQSKSQLPIHGYSEQKPFGLLYVSMIDVYKNQPQVVLAVNSLRQKGYPLSLTLVGPSEAKALGQLQIVIDQVDPQGIWLHYLGPIAYEQLSIQYQQADLGVFASTCETFGMIVLEKMAAGLPIACSNQSSMSEILADAGLYFDPHNSESIAHTIEQYLCSTQLREQHSERAYTLAKNYSWHNCAQQTIDFLHQVVQSTQSS